MESLSLSALQKDKLGQRLLLIVVLILGVVVFKVLWNGIRNPLRVVPGPWYARWTSLPLKLAIIGGRRIMYVDDLHKKYGPYVLLAPTQVSVLSQEGFATIHKVGTSFVKSPWYAKLTSFDRPMVFSMSDRKMHAERRKLHARPFSKANLQANHESTVHAFVLSTIAQMEKSGAGGQPVDILKWWMLMASDIVSKLMLGKCFEGIKRGEMNEHLRAVKTAAKGKGILIELPGWVGWMLKRVPTTAVRRLFNSNPIVTKYGQLAIEGGKAEGGEILFAKVFEKATEGTTLDDYDVLLEGSGLIIAGTDTTANTLTYLVWAVLCHPAWQTLLEEEVAKLDQDFTAKDLEKLPVLNAIIDETLRLYTAAPGALQRMVPANGAQFGDYFLPAGTTVSTQAYSFHRHSSWFPEPFKFDPDRFIPGSDTQLSTSAHSVYHPFGAGSHICLGLHLARMELQLATVEFFRHFRGARLADSTTDASMEMTNFFLIMPKAEKCEILL